MVNKELRNRFAIVGVGYTPQGKIPGRTAVSFHVEACRNAAADAGIDKREIGALLLYRHFDPLGTDWDVTGFTVAEQLGIRPAVISQEAYCTRTWLTQALGLLELGVCRFVVVSYGDNARSHHRSFVKELRDGQASDDLATYGDLSTMAKYAMIARRAMHLYRTGPDVWKEIAIAQRRWACLNPAAGMFGKPLDDESYDSSRMIVEPLRMLDATPTSDGGRAIVITTAEIARAICPRPVYISGFGCASQPVSPFRITAEDPQSAAKISCHQALEMAGITLPQIDACELYDCFTYTVEATLRDYGFFAAEDAAQWITRERLGPGGELPVNTSGGMLSEAYFMGLTPVSEAVMQLMGRCKERQLGGALGGRAPQNILCSDNGSVFQSHCSLILSRG